MSLNVTKVLKVITFDPKYNKGPKCNKASNLMILYHYYCHCYNGGNDDDGDIDDEDDDDDETSIQAFVYKAPLFYFIQLARRIDQCQQHNNDKDSCSFCSSYQWQK